MQNLTGLISIIFTTIQPAVPPAEPSLTETIMDGLNLEFVGGLIGIIALASGVFFTWREKKTSSIAGFRAYEKDLQEQMTKDNKRLRENSEKYLMLRSELFSMPGIDADVIIRKIEQEYRDLNPPN